MKSLGDAFRYKVNLRLRVALLRDPGHDAPPLLGTANSIASSNRFCSLRFG
jgi:hypothetical protein